MNYQKLRECFSSFKDVKGVDFSILSADNYGPSPSSTWGEINNIYSDNSKGIYLKHWFKTSLNNEGPKDINSIDKAYIAHRLDNNLAKDFYKIFSKYYNISPKEWDDNKCFILIEKDNK